MLAAIIDLPANVGYAAVFALIATNPSPWWVDGLVYTAVAATVISGADYFFGLRRRLRSLEPPATRAS